MADVWKDGKKVEEVTFSGGTFDSSGRTLTPSGGAGGSVATDAIFTAKGDLPVGTGASTAQKVSVGANDYGLIADSAETTGVKWAPVFRGSTGTSMPGSPATNDRVFRTDLGLEFYYDGTRWLTTQLFRSSGYGEFALGTVSPNPFMRLPIPSLDMWMVSLECTTYVVTNSGSAYWTISLVKSTAAAAETTIVSFTTAADTQANYVRHNTAIDAALGGGATYPTILGKTAKTSTPGGLFLAGQLNYRLIGT